MIRVNKTVKSLGAQVDLLIMVIGLTLSLVGLFSFHSIALADPLTAPSGTPLTAPTSTGTSDIDCKNNPDACLYNPLPTDNLVTMFLIILRGFLYMTGIVSVIFIVVGGFKMVVAQGNEESYESARKTITWAIMGLVVALLSFSIVAIVQYILGASLPGAGGVF